MPRQNYLRVKLPLLFGRLLAETRFGASANPDNAVGERVLTELLDARNAEHIYAAAAAEGIGCYLLGGV